MVAVVMITVWVMTAAGIVAVALMIMAPVLFIRIGSSAPMVMNAAGAQQRYQQTNEIDYSFHGASSVATDTLATG